jgi:hypothetical protein
MFLKPIEKTLLDGAREETAKRLTLTEQLEATKRELERLNSDISTVTIGTMNALRKQLAECQRERDLYKEFSDNNDEFVKQALKAITEERDVLLAAHKAQETSNLQMLAKLKQQAFELEAVAKERDVLSRANELNKHSAAAMWKQLEAVRDATLEEAAKVCFEIGATDNGYACDFAIRALKREG